MNDVPIAGQLLGLFTAPTATLARLGGEESAQSGASVVALLGIAWTVLSIVLWRGGHQPSFAPLPPAPEHHYLVQGVLMTPLLTALWWLSSTIAIRIAVRLGGRGHPGGTRAALGLAYGAPMLLFHVLPELVTLAAFDFGALARVGRITLPLAALLVWLFSAWALRITHRIGRLGAAFAAFVGLLAQAIVGSLVLR